MRNGTDVELSKTAWPGSIDAPLRMWTPVVVQDAIVAGDRSPKHPEDLQTRRDEVAMRRLIPKSKSGQHLTRNEPSLSNVLGVNGAHQCKLRR